MNKKLISPAKAADTSAASLQEATVKIREARSILQDAISSLAASETSKHYVKATENRINFTELVAEIGGSHSELVDPHVDFDMICDRLPGIKALREFQMEMEELQLQTDEVGRFIISAPHKEALMFYRYLRGLANNMVKGARAFYDKLKEYFPNGKKKTSEKKNSAKGGDNT